MARGTTTRSVRRDAPLGEGERPVQLNAGKRFFTAQGNDSANRKARALTNALGVGLEAYGQKLERDNVKGSAQALSESASGGERDADNANKGYNEAFDQVEASNDLAIFATELPAMLEKEGWIDLSPEEAQARIDGYYADQLQGINPDSVYGKIVAEGILKQNSMLIETHRGFKFEQAQQERRIMIDNELQADYKLNGAIDHEKLMDRLGTLVPGPGGRTGYLESVFDLAKRTGDIEILRSIPERFPNGDPTGIEDPKMKPLFDKAMSDAVDTRDAMLEAKTDAWLLENKNNRALTRADHDDRVQLADPTVLNEIAAGGLPGPNDEPPIYTELQQAALYKKWGDAQTVSANNKVLLFDWMNGDGIGFTQAQVDAAHLEYVKLLKNNVPEGVESQGEDAVNDWINIKSRERGTVNGKLPSIYSDQMKVNLSNPEKFKDAAAFYDELETNRPGFAETQIGHPQSMKLYAYNRILADTGGNEGKAIEMMELHKLGRWKDQSNEVGKVVARTLLEFNDQSGFDNFNTTTRVAALVEEEVRFYVDMGFDPETSGKYALEHLERRTVRAGDEVYAPDAGWGEDPQGVYDFQIRTRAEQLDIDPDDLSIIPTADPTRVRFVDVNRDLPDVQTFLIADLTKGFNSFNSVDEQERARALVTSSSDRMVEAESRAYDKRYGGNPWGDSGMRAQMAKINRQAWTDMSKKDRDRLIGDQLLVIEAASK